MRNNMKELKRRLRDLEPYFFDVCFYEENFIIVRCTDRDFKMDFVLMEKLIQLSTDIKYKYNIRVEYVNTEYYKDLNFEIV